MKDLVSDGFAQVVKPYIDAQDKTTREILAPVEADETDASRAYQIGDQLILGGILYDVIAPISQHGIITSTGSGANIEEADNITEQIGSVNSALTNLDAEVTNAENILGAKNLLPNKGTTQTINGVTFTVRSDGSVVCNGTPEGTSSAVFSLYTNNGTEDFTGKEVILSGCPSGGSATTYYLHGSRVGTVDGSSGTVDDYGEGTEFTFRNNASGTRASISIIIANGQTVSNLVFYPMLRLASIKDDTYAPYAMTNRELTNKVSGLIYSQSIIANTETSIPIKSYNVALLIVGNTNRDADNCAMYALFNNASPLPIKTATSITVTSGTNTLKVTSAYNNTATILYLV